MPAKLLFFGTPEFAIPTLEKLQSKFEISVIVTQPDRPSGRGLTLKASPVKQFAINNSIQYFQPSSLKSSTQTGELDQQLNKIDAAICVAYGNIIPDRYLKLFSSGIINIHPSLLPRWRGAAPLQWSIFSGDKTTGISLMRLDQGLDTGDVFITEPCEIEEQDTLGTLHDKLAERGADLLFNSLESIISGHLLPKSQSNQGVTYAEKWEKEHARIVWNDSALITNQRIRASNPIPGAFCEYNNSNVKIFSANQITNFGYKNTEPGEIVAINKTELIVCCGDSSYLAINEMQMPGKNRLKVSEILRGSNFKVGEKFN